MIIVHAPPHAAAPLPAAQARPGRGTRLTQSRLGFAYSAGGGGGKFAHPFRPALGSLSAIFSRGLVETFEPTIKGVPISGSAAQPQPPLALDPQKANKAGESWCCIEVTPNAQGTVDKNSRIEMVHTDQPTSVDPAIGRCPVALVLWSAGQPTRLLEILYFNVRYQRVIPAGGSVRHLFW